MPRFPRLVVPDYPHHVTQRGARKQATFFSNDDYRTYLSLLREFKSRRQVQIWAYCLMPNHVHVIAVPTDAAGLGKLFGTVHQRYARRVNATNSWSGHLWQERFYSVVMDERHALAAMRYVEMNPVRAGLCDVADQWPWSSVHGHLRANYDDVLDSCFTQQLIPDWRSFLAMDEPRGWADSLRAQTSSGRPCGADHFIEAIERKTGRRVRRIKPGPLPKN